MDLPRPVVDYGTLMISKPDPILLTDAQVARFITDGYLQFDCGLPAALHAAIYEKLQWILHEEGNPGNNILPAVPELQQVLDSPVVRGALAGILGPDYVLHPHRFVHNIEPAERTAEGLQIGKGSASFVGWHQDSHSPLARPRHHYPRYAMLLYYPQDTPIEMGPTQIIPATHLHGTITEDDRARGFQAPGPAGTCTLVHFDIAHGGSPNLADRTRHMAKFVFARVSEPNAPSWSCQDDAWHAPASHQAPHDLSDAWSHLWSWMAGRPGRTAGSASNGEPGAESIAELVAGMDAESFTRIRSIYALAALGEPAVEALCAQLTSRQESRWEEGAVVMESAAYALAAMGEPAVPALTGLLAHPSEWVRINALFALGEIGPRAGEAAPRIIECLRDASHPVVRTALDAIGQMQAGEQALPEIKRLLTTERQEWQEPLRRRWTGENQVHVNAMMALLRTPSPSEALLETVGASLDDPCGYVGGFGVEILLRHPTAEGLRAAIAYLQSHRWDNTLNRGIRTY